MFIGMPSADNSYFGNFVVSTNSLSDGMATKFGFYMRGSGQSFGNVPLYIAYRYVADPANIKLFIKGPDYASSKFPLYLLGPVPISASLSLYIRGLILHTSSLNLYLDARGNVVPKDIPLFMFGSSVSSPGIVSFKSAPLYLYGMAQTPFWTNGIKLFMNAEAGIPYYSSSANLFIRNDISKYSSGIGLYLSNQSAGTFAGKKSLYTVGLGTVVSSKNLLYINVKDGIIGRMGLFMNGNIPTNNSMNMFLRGTNVNTGVMNSYIKGLGNDSAMKNLFLRGY